jgi:hypothetical protein
MRRPVDPDPNQSWQVSAVGEMPTRAQRTGRTTCRTKRNALRQARQTGRRRSRPGRIRWTGEAQARRATPLDRSIERDNGRMKRSRLSGTVGAESSTPFTAMVCISRASVIDSFVIVRGD